MVAKRLNVTPEQYHADPAAVPSLSSSLAHTLLTKSPAHAWTEHPKLGNVRKDSTPAMDDGTLIHRLLLGKGAEIESINAPDFRTKAAREAKAEALEAGRIPVLVEKLVTATEAAKQIRQNLGSFGISLIGESEIAFEWEEVGLHGPVTCRCMMDHAKIDAGQILDVKKIVSADPRTIEIHGYRYGMDIQAAAYSSALLNLRPDLAGRNDFLFLFCEFEPPYAVVPARPSGAFMALGESRWLRAVQLWEQCLRDDKWPAYPAMTLEPPAWAIATEEAHFDDPI